jgi:hypothetical protein
VLTVVLCLFVALLIGEGVNDAIDQSPAVGARAKATWVAGIQPVLVSSSAIAPALADVERNPGALTRQSLDAATAALSEVLSGNQRAVASLGIKAPSARLSALVQQLLNERLSAFHSFAQMIAAATSLPHDDAAALSACMVAQGEIHRADATLASLGHSLGAQFASVFRSAPTWSSVVPHLETPGCTTLVNALGGNAALVEHRGLRLVAISVVPNPVQINGVPNPTTTTTSTTTTPGTQTTTTTTTTPVQTGTTSTTSTTTTTIPPVTTTTLQIPPASAKSVLPPTGTLAVQVVIQASGNQRVGPVIVSVQLVPAATEAGATRSRTITGLAPGASRYLAFSGIPLGNITGRFVLKVSATALGVPVVERSITLVRSPH